VFVEQIQDGQVHDGHKVLSARKRLGMVGVLAVVAGTAIFFNAEEQAAEAKIWDSEMAGHAYLFIADKLRNIPSMNSHI